ncbi:EF-P 5-aminopentanol modification-associated protein YfmH [Acetivibrio sp. MSJd-27]|uniref:EF-P 5-aminopentanol modification-associated protein YfmH n=1 Tax=Acetivibrio sp. MSJd-27 TaxID=2841523 RepID=UPI001C112AB0|nr:pitrilysin family protein [Acetivibrio sp. MSJd-27]MBU5450655.1 insulinase family protein [Acetivibrio sp. MSJd-27]
MKFEKIANPVIEETFYKGVHESGLPVYVLKKENYSKYYSILSTRYGSVDSAFQFPGDREYTIVPDGIAHFLEHKLFEQEDGTNAFDKYAALGASANAFTSFNNTAYLFSCTSHFNENFDHLLNFVSHPYFTRENVEKEQGIIAQEIRMYDDDANWRVFFNLIDCLYINHPVKKDIAGTVESISKITKDILFDTYHTFYHPENMVLYIAGDVNLEEISDIIDRNIVKREVPFNAEVKPIEEPGGINRKEKVQKLSVSTPIFNCGYKDKNVNLRGKDLLKRNLMTSILLKMFASESSELYEKLYSQGLINDSFGTDMTCFYDYSFVQFEGESKEPKRVAAMILEQAAKLKEYGLNQDDFERTKKLMYGKYVKSFNSIEAIGNSFCSDYFLGIEPFAFFEVYEDIHFSEVQNRFHELFDENMFAVSIIEPV